MGKEEDKGGKRGRECGETRNEHENEENMAGNGRVKPRRGRKVGTVCMYEALALVM